MSRSIARALRHGKFSEHKIKPEQREKFMTRVLILDAIVEDCMKKRKEGIKSQWDS